MTSVEGERSRFDNQKAISKVFLIQGLLEQAFSEPPQRTTEEESRGFLDFFQEWQEAKQISDDDQKDIASSIQIEDINRYAQVSYRIAADDVSKVTNPDSVKGHKIVRSFLLWRKITLITEKAVALSINSQQQVS